MSYQTVIGLEVHLELGTETKMFCRCPADHFGKKANTQTCPNCLGLPGAMPYPNQKAIEWTILFGLALGCRIPLKAKFDRKHYFYPDLPKGYQISQYDQPFCQQGQVVILGDDDRPKKIRVNRVHLEEDAGKLIHRRGKTLVDFNRAGVPLVEIVSEPDLGSAEEAEKYAKKIQQLARWLEISAADMEKGQLRLELNLSLRPEGQKELPSYRVEVKNINSFKFLKKAAEFEIKRQTAMLDRGVTPDQETRGFDEEKGTTFVQRSKEEAHDYRYFPEPDIPPFVWTQAEVKKIKKRLPLLPEEIYQKLIKLEVREREARLLGRERQLAFLALETMVLGAKKSVPAQIVANLLVNQKTTKGLTPAKTLSQLKKPTGISKDTLKSHISEVIKQNPTEVERYRQGKKELINFFVGQLMAATKGQASPAAAREALIRALEK